VHSWGRTGPSSSARLGSYDQMDLMLIRQDILERSPQVALKALRAMLDAERYASTHPGERRPSWRGASKLTRGGRRSACRPQAQCDPVAVAAGPAGIAEARWAIKTGLTDRTEMPDYLNLIDVDDLKKLKPEVVR